MSAPLDLTALDTTSTDPTERSLRVGTTGRGRSLAKRLAFTLDDIVPSETGTVILAYHRVGGATPSPVDISAPMFRRQVAHLCAAASVGSLDAFVDAVSNGHGEVPEVVVTFDDGTADFVDEVLPVLVEFQIPATLYLATGPVDSGSPYPDDGQPISWAGLREAVSTGLVTVGSHTHDHRLLDRCSASEAADQLDRANDRIRDELGVDPRHFAYPKAVRARRAVEREVAARYVSAAVAGTRPNALDAVDLLGLRRSPIQVADRWEGFVRKVSGGMRVEDDVRRAINRYRYRGATS